MVVRGLEMAKDKTAKKSMPRSFIARGGEFLLKCGSHGPTARIIPEKLQTSHQALLGHCLAVLIDTTTLAVERSRTCIIRDLFHYDDPS